MNSYSIRTIKSAEDDLEKLKHKRDKAVKKLIKLEENPKEKSSSLSGSHLQGLYSYSFTLKGAGSYRAIFDIIEDNKVCLLIMIGPRENFYVKARKKVKDLKDKGII